MKVIQGRYIGKIKSGKGTIKGLRIATDKGKEKIYLPKSLRKIAQAELALEMPVRIWVDGDRSSNKKLYALQLIPLAPKSALSIEDVSKQKTINKDKKKRKAKVTVQLCQKKNCCKKGGDELWQAFERASQQQDFKLEPVGCLGGCKRGPNIRLLPDNVKYRHVQLAEIDGILQAHRA